jgi:hypothetical protein
MMYIMFRAGEHDAMNELLATCQTAVLGGDQMF